MTNQIDRKRTLAAVAFAALSALAWVDATALSPRLEIDGRIQAKGGGIVEGAVVPGAVLRTGDELRLKITSWSDGHLYVISLGSSGTATLLHPFIEASAEAAQSAGIAAPVLAGETVLVPSDGGFLPLDDHSGREMIVAFVSPQPVETLTRLMFRMEGLIADPQAARDVLVSAGFEPAHFSFVHAPGDPLLTQVPPSSAMAADLLTNNVSRAQAADVKSAAKLEVMSDSSVATQGQGVLAGLGSRIAQFTGKSPAPPRAPFRVSGEATRQAVAQQTAAGAVVAGSAVSSASASGAATAPATSDEGESGFVSVLGSLFGTGRDAAPSSAVASESVPEPVSEQPARTFALPVERVPTQQINQRELVSTSSPATQASVPAPSASTHIALSDEPSPGSATGRIIEPSPVEATLYPPEQNPPASRTSLVDAQRVEASTALRADGGVQSTVSRLFGGGETDVAQNDAQQDIGKPRATRPSVAVQGATNSSGGESRALQPGLAAAAPKEPPSRIAAPTAKAPEEAAKVTDVPPDATVIGAADTTAESGGWFSGLSALFSGAESGQPSPRADIDADSSFSAQTVPSADEVRENPRPETPAPGSADAPSEFDSKIRNSPQPSQSASVASSDSSVPALRSQVTTTSDTPQSARATASAAMPDAASEVVSNASNANDTSGAVSASALNSEADTEISASSLKTPAAPGEQGVLSAIGSRLPAVTVFERERDSAQTASVVPQSVPQEPVARKSGAPGEEREAQRPGGLLAGLSALLGGGSASDSSASRPATAGQEAARQEAARQERPLAVDAKSPDDEPPPQSSGGVLAERTVSGAGSSDPAADALQPQIAVQAAEQQEQQDPLVSETTSPDGEAEAQNPGGLLAGLTALLGGASNPSSPSAPQVASAAQQPASQEPAVVEEQSPSDEREAQGSAGQLADLGAAGATSGSPSDTALLQSAESGRQEPVVSETKSLAGEQEAQSSGGLLAGLSALFGGESGTSSPSVSQPASAGGGPPSEERTQVSGRDSLGLPVTQPSVVDVPAKTPSDVVIPLPPLIEPGAGQDERTQDVVSAPRVEQDVAQQPSTVVETEDAASSSGLFAGLGRLFGGRAQSESASRVNEDDNVLARADTSVEVEQREDPAGTPEPQPVLVMKPQASASARSLPSATPEQSGQPEAAQSGGFLAGLGALLASPFSSAEPEPADVKSAEPHAQPSGSRQVSKARVNTGREPTIERRVREGGREVVVLEGPSLSSPRTSMGNQEVLSGSGSRIRSLLDEPEPQNIGNSPLSVEGSVNSEPPVAASPSALELPPQPAAAVVESTPTSSAAALNITSPPLPAPTAAANVPLDPVQEALGSGRGVVDAPVPPLALLSTAPAAKVARAADQLAEVDLNSRSGVAATVVLVVTPQGSTSGVLVDRNGHILTNWHTVHDYDAVVVMFKQAGGTVPARTERMRARVVGHSKYADLALLKVESIPVGVAPAPIVTSVEVQSGAPIHAIGHSGGREGQWRHAIASLDRIRQNSSWYSKQRVLHRADVIRAKMNPAQDVTGAPLFNNQLELIGLGAMVRADKGEIVGVSAPTIRVFLAAPG